MDNQLLYPNFLQDQQTYHLVVAYWQRLVKQVLSDTELTFHPFYTERYGNGQRVYDANPIFDAYFPDRHKLLRIIQYIPEPDDRLLSAYIDHWPLGEMASEQRPRPTDPAKADQPIPELVIALALTRETAARARALIGRWMKEDIGEVEMGKILDALA